MASQPLILVTISGGGWHRQTYRLIEQFPAGEFRFAYVYGCFAGNDSARRVPMPQQGPRFALPCLGQTNQHPLRHLGNAGRFLRSFLDAWQLLQQVNPDAVLAVANSTALPLFVAGRLLGIRCVFVESLTRTRRLSRTGWLIYRLRLATRLYVQWPALAVRHPRTSFAGAII